MTNLRCTTLDTPAGPWGIVVDRDGVVLASGLQPAATLLARLDAGSAAEAEVVADLGTATDSARRYLDGDLRALDAVPVAQPGGPFLQEVWRVLRDVPAGETWSYAELAARAGRPRAVRAAGGACARNRVAPFVPCHRIVRSDGTLGGYAYGLAAKRWLLAHERGSG